LKYHAQELSYAGIDLLQLIKKGKKVKRTTSAACWSKTTISADEAKDGIVQKCIASTLLPRGREITRLPLT